MRLTGKKVRLRREPTPDGQLVVVAYDAQGKEVERSPAGSDRATSDYLFNYLKYGAWKKS